MAIRDIIVHEHKKRMGDGSATQHQQFASKVRDILSNVLSVVELNKLEVFNLMGEYIEFHAGNTNRAIIFGNGSRKASGTKTERSFTYKGFELVETMLEPRGDGILINEDGGNPIAEYFRDTNELYILFDIFKSNEIVSHQIFQAIIRDWFDVYWKTKALEDSWLHSSIKDQLTARFERRMKESLDRQLHDDKQRAESYSRRIEDYKREIKNAYDNMIRLRNAVEINEKNAVDVSAKLKKELDMIVAHPKVEDLHIKNEWFIIYVPKVYAYDDKDNRYYIGNMRIELNIENADLRFYGDNPRRGFWTANDPHPHVSGSNGSACLGNTSGTIAELCSRNELYAVVLTCIGFLEAANTADPAGRNVVRWDCVDEEGNVIDAPDSADDDEEGADCDCCGDWTRDDDIRRVFRHVDEDGDVYDELYVCETCRNNHYSYWDSIDEYVHDDYEESDYDRD